MQALTSDPFLNGKIVLHQPRSGYRFSIDAVLLAHLAAPLAGETVVDLGTGCGVIPVLLAYRNAQLQIIGVEIQPDLAALARRNVADNQMSEQVRIVEGDMARLKSADLGGAVDCVVTNPPYRKLDSGRINADGQKAVARHEIKVDLQAVLDSGARVLKRTGRFVIIYPSVRTVDLLAGMRRAGIEPKRMTLIHSTATGPARLVAVSGHKGGRSGLEVTPPLHLYEADGTHTPRVQAMFNG